MFHASFCTLHLMHYTMLYSAHLYSYTIDSTKPELEETAKTKLTEGKPGASHPFPLAFILITTLCYICLCIKFVGADWYRRCIMSIF
jgi:hypothetical protein